MEKAIVCEPDKEDLQMTECFLVGVSKFDTILEDLIKDFYKGGYFNLHFLLLGNKKVLIDTRTPKFANNILKKDN